MQHKIYCDSEPDAKRLRNALDKTLPARTALLAAALDVDQGGANYGCELAQVSAALSFVSSLGVALPQGVKDAQALLVTIPCTAPTLDAGSPLEVVTSTADASAALVKSATPSTPILDGGIQ